MAPIVAIVPLLPLPHPLVELGQLIGNQYRIGKQLKHYKELFECVDEQSGEQLIIKVESIQDNVPNQLEKEWKYYQKLSTSDYFSFVVDCVKDQKNNYLLMKRLGENLQSFYHKMLRRGEWDLELVVFYAEEMVARVASCHLRNVIHRDIKPENFCVDPNDTKNLFLIDLNLAKEFATLSEPHIPYRRRNPKFSVGNVQFLSVNAHKGEEQSRRDDMISVGYSIIYLAKGWLPWSDIHSTDFESRAHYLEAVGQLKKNCSAEQLCNGLPDQFKQYMNYCLDLGFYDKPNYFYLRKLFTHLSTQLQTSKVSTKLFESKIASNGWKSRNNSSKYLSKFINSSPPMKCP